jgi:hypothetical protein
VWDRIVNDKWDIPLGETVPGYDDLLFIRENGTRMLRWAGHDGEFYTVDDYAIPCDLA